MTRAEVKERNILMMQDYANDVPVNDIKLRYGVKIANIYRTAFNFNIVRETKPKKVREELPPRLEALRQRYRDYDPITDNGKALNISMYDFDYIAMPKRF